MPRDHKAEYKRRVERGLARGLTRSQARGHARSGEAPLRSTERLADERLAKARKEFIRSGNLSKAAKLSGVAEERLRRDIVQNKIGHRQGRGWQLINREVRVTTRGRERWIKVGFEAASLVGSHNEAIKRFRRTNDLSVLELFQGQVAVDLAGRKYPLETRPNVLHRLAAAGSDGFEHVYRLTA